MCESVFNKIKTHYFFTLTFILYLLTLSLVYSFKFNYLCHFYLKIQLGSTN